MDENIRENDDIDYLHPDGKPETKHVESRVDDYDGLKSYWYALQEADGHSMYKPDPFLHSEDEAE